MKPAIKKAWIKALRSGEYKQGWCCLGVLDDTEVPPNVRKAIGLSEKHMNSLVDFNDSDRWSFKTIAKWIEENL